METQTGRRFHAALLAASLTLLLTGVASLTSPLLSPVRSRALVDAAPASAWIFGGAWVDVDGDGDLDFVLPGDPEKGVHLQWVEFIQAQQGGPVELGARALDPDISNLPDAQVIRNRYLGTRGATSL